jgi:hypothetical protein
MPKFWILSAACILVGALGANRTLAANVIVGVNVVGVENLSETQQDALVVLLQKEGVRTVRTRLGDKFTHFITSAFRHGIGTVVIIDPTVGSAAASQHAPERTRRSPPGSWAVCRTPTQRALENGLPHSSRAWSAMA